MEAADGKLRAANSVAAEHAALREAHATAMEQLRERDEALAEQRADVEDMKAAYRGQIDALATQLAAAVGSG
jgi:hypothetical protein